MGPCEVIVLGVLIALSICDSFSLDELNVLGNLISAIGSMVSTCAAQKEYLEEAHSDKPTLEELEKQIQALQKECSGLKKGAKALWN